MFEKPYEELDSVSQAEVRLQLRMNESYASKYAGTDIVRQHFEKYAEDCGLDQAGRAAQIQPFFNGAACMLSIVGEISNDTDLLEEVMGKLVKELEQ